MKSATTMPSERLAFKKFYSKTDLSVMYFQRSVKNFVAEINLFLPKLQKIGYTQHQKLFTLKQVEVIFEHLGHPESSRYVSDLLQADNNRIPIRCYRKTDLRKLFFLEKRTFNRVLKEYLPAGFAKNGSHFYKKAEIELIFEKIGHPFANYDIIKG